MDELVRVADTPGAVADLSLTRALGLHHTLVSAIADLVDNSLDAGARNVLVRFVRDGTTITGLRIIDDGRGMSAETMDAAMKYGSQREYGADDLGHFGVGMKAASLSQASTLVVWSKAEGHPVQGRRIDSASSTVSTLDSTDAKSVFGSARPRFPLEVGTIVEWQNITTFLMSADEDEQVGWLENAIADVRSHLGIVFHRILGEYVSMKVDVVDARYGRPGAGRSIEAIDPFGYQVTGADSYPRTSTLDIGHGESVVTAHIWPARSGLPEYRLFGAPGRDRQGLYFYRNRRLLQIGGWNGLWHARPDYGPARVAIELDETLMRHVQINPEKAGVTLDATVSAALHAALASLLTDTVAATTAARTRTPKPISVVQPSTGLPEDLLDVFSDAFTFDDGQEPVAVKWRVLARDSFFEVDLRNRTLWVNARFRTALIGRRSRVDTDLPMVKTLLYLLVQHMFTAQRLSGKQVDQIQAWQGVLISAMAAHSEQSGAEQ